MHFFSQSYSICAAALLFLAPWMRYFIGRMCIPAEKKYCFAGDNYIPGYGNNSTAREMYIPESKMLFPASKMLFPEKKMLFFEKKMLFFF